jgi:hypothetical protein
MMIRSLFAAVVAVGLLSAPARANEMLGSDIPRPDGKPADMSKPVKVFILLGQSNMVGAGKVDELEKLVKGNKAYPFLVDDAGAWVTRQDVRYTQMMQGKGLQRNDWLVVKGKTLGPEYGIGHKLGNAIDAPVLLLKSCIGNRSLGWDLLPPGSERFVEGGVVYAGYKEKPASWPADPAKGKATEPPPFVDKAGKPINWYAGKNWDDDIGNAKTVLADLKTYYPEATGFEVAGFFMWQGEKDAGNPVHAARYEQNIVQFIKALRKEFNAPDAKFVMGTIGEVKKGSSGNGGKILEGMLAADGESGKYPEFKGNVATVYTHEMARGSSGNAHYGGKPEVYMDVGIAMGDAMLKLLGSSSK